MSAPGLLDMDLSVMNLYVNELNASVTRLKVQRNVYLCFALRHKPDGNELQRKKMIQFQPNWCCSSSLEISSDEWPRLLGPADAWGGRCQGPS